MNRHYEVLLITVVALVTMVLRFLPFFVFGGGKETPKYISYLGKYLPYAIIGMLVVYCLKGISFVNAPYGIPEALGVVAVVGLHLWKRNTLLSIAGGTILYMILIQNNIFL